MLISKLFQAIMGQVESGTYSKEERRQTALHRDAELRQWSTQNRISYINAGISFIGPIAGLGTIWLTLGALHASQTAASASIESARQATRQADAASRSYIYLGLDGAQSVSDFTFGKGMFRVSIIASNLGNAPASIINVQCTIGWGYKDGPWPRAFDALEHDAHTDNAARANGLTLAKTIATHERALTTCGNSWPWNDAIRPRAPGGVMAGIREFINGMQIVDNETVELPPNTPNVIWVVSRVTYADPSGDQHFVNLCAYNDGGGDLTPSGGPECSARDK